MLAALEADIVYLGIHSGPGGRFLRRLRERGLVRPVFVVLGRIGRMLNVLAPEPYDADMYRTWPRAGPPRLQRALAAADLVGAARTLDLRGQARRQRPGALREVGRPGRDRRRAASRPTGARSDAACSTPISSPSSPMPPATTPAAPLPTCATASSTASAGSEPTKRIYRGLWQDWSFTEGRSAADDILIAHKPAQLVRRIAGAGTVPAWATFDHPGAGDLHGPRRHPHLSRRQQRKDLSRRVLPVTAQPPGA